MYICLIKQVIIYHCLHRKYPRKSFDDSLHPCSGSIDCSSLDDNSPPFADSGFSSSGYTSSFYHTHTPPNSQPPYKATDIRHIIQDHDTRPRSIPPTISAADHPSTTSPSFDSYTPHTAFPLASDSIDEGYDLLSFSQSSSLSDFDKDCFALTKRQTSQPELGFAHLQSPLPPCLDSRSPSTDCSAGKYAYRKGVIEGGDQMISGHMAATTSQTIPAMSVVRQRSLPESDFPRHKKESTNTRSKSATQTPRALVDGRTSISKVADFISEEDSAGSSSSSVLKHSTPFAAAILPLPPFRPLDNAYASPFPSTSSFHAHINKDSPTVHSNWEFNRSHTTDDERIVNPFLCIANSATVPTSNVDVDYRISNAIPFTDGTARSSAVYPTACATRKSIVITAPIQGPFLSNNQLFEVASLEDTTSEHKSILTPPLIEDDLKVHLEDSNQKEHCLNRAASNLSSKNSPVNPPISSLDSLQHPQLSPLIPTIDELESTAPQTSKVSSSTLDNLNTSCNKPSLNDVPHVIQKLKFKPVVKISPQVSTIKDPYHLVVKYLGQPKCSICNELLDENNNNQVCNLSLISNQIYQSFFNYHLIQNTYNVSTHNNISAIK